MVQTSLQAQKAEQASRVEAERLAALEMNHEDHVKRQEEQDLLLAQQFQREEEEKARLV
jgi:hypothetical protein